MARPFRVTPRRALLMLWLATLVLVVAGLGAVPLRDWDEGIVARVALETSRRPWPEGLLPTFWGSTYLNKPPGLHWLIAGCIQLWQAHSGSPPSRPPEWVVRLAPALLSSLIVPLVGLLQMRLRPGRPGVAVCSAAIALTLLPLTRHGRLAMLDGAQLTAMVLLWLGLLQSSRQPVAALRGGMVAGLAGSGLLLLKAPVVLPVLGTGLLLRLLDRELPARSWRWLGAGLALGLLPGLAWHGWHLLQRGDEALVMWGVQGLSRFASTVEEHHGSPIEPLLEVLEGGWPWLPLWPFGVAMAWRERGSRAGRWSLGLTLATALMVLPMRTQLPWYSLLLWPPFCLVCSPALERLVGERRPGGFLGRVRWLWMLLGGLMLLAVVVAAIPGLLPAGIVSAYRWLPLPAALGLGFGGWALGLAERRARRLGLVALLTGWVLSLLLFFLSPAWNWELNETWSVLPPAALARGAGSATGVSALPIYMEGRDGQRPSLRWYAEREIFNLPDGADDHWPGAFRVLLRREDATGPSHGATGDTRPRILRRQGLDCHLEVRGEENWERWICSRRDGGSGGAP